MSQTSKQVIGEFISQLSAKSPTPGGGGASAIGAAIGGAAAKMAAAYTSRKKDIETGAALKAETLMKRIDTDLYIQAADEDAKAYSDLQRTWKESDMSSEEKERIQAAALAVPVKLLETCHKNILDIQAFLPYCNTGILSDAKVGIHQLAGASRAAFQTAIVNSPTEEEKKRLKQLLREIQKVEDAILDLDYTDEK